MVLNEIKKELAIMILVIVVCNQKRQIYNKFGALIFVLSYCNKLIKSTMHYYKILLINPDANLLFDNLQLKLYNL